MTVDYTSFGKNGEAASGKRLVPRMRWWEVAGSKEVADAIAARTHFMQGQQGLRIRQAIINARLYGNMSLFGVAGYTSQSLGSANTSAVLKERISDNVVQSVVDTATARIGENKPRPYFLTSDGDYQLQRRAKRLNQWTEGLFFEQKAYEVGGDAQRDAEVFGDGLLYIGVRGNRVFYTRALASEVWVDEVESLYGNPREMHWVRFQDRDSLLAEYKKGLSDEGLLALKNATKAPLADNGRDASTTDVVLLRHSWHLPSAEGAEDGMHVVSTDAGVVMSEPWTHAWFPFARFQWTPRPLGYWSQGLAEQLQNKQLEINRILDVIQKSFRLAGSFKVLLQNGSKVVPEHVTNEVGAIIKWTGSKPEYVVPPVVPVEYYQHLQTLTQSCYERAGISLQSATGQKPAGLNSGEAQRVYRDTVAERLKTQERLNERGYMDLALKSVVMARDVCLKTGKPYEVQSAQRRAMADVSLSAEELNPVDWKLQCFPTSSLPRDPAGRLQTVQEYVQAGFITQRQARKLLDFPDIDALESLASAAEDLITKMLDAICDGVASKEDYPMPEPTDDLQLATELVVEYINRGRMLGLSPERLELLRTWQQQVQAMQQQAMSAMAPPPGVGAPPGPGGGVPQAVPQAAPQSDLLPQAA